MKVCTMPRLFMAITVAAACSPPPSAPDAGLTADIGADLPIVDGGADASDAAGRPDASDVAPAHDLQDTPVAMDEAVFAATHNSYSGGARGTIREQLDAGVRFLEFDVHADDFDTVGYQVGHDAPGHEVQTGSGNPEGLALVAWLAVIQTWRAENPNHAPLTIGLDLKSDLWARPTAEAGNLGAFQLLLERTFGDALFTEDEAARGWPTVDELRGRVLAVLSGNTATRLAHRRVIGSNPAIAVNDFGSIVVAHESEHGVTVWAGSKTQGMRHFQHLPGADPAVALQTDAVVLLTVEGAAVVARHGRLADGDIVWDYGPTALPDAEPVRAPSVRFTHRLVENVRAVHETATGELRAWSGAWDGVGFNWAAGTASERWDEAAVDGFSIHQQATAPFGDILAYSEAATTRRVRLAATMFSESQFSGPTEFEADQVLFFAADAFSPQGVSWATEKRRAGGIVRLWKFNLPNVTPDPAPSFPATDAPRGDFYRGYCASMGCVDFDPGG